MTVHLVTFSDASMSRARNLCAESSFSCGVKDAARYNEYLIVERSDWQQEWNAQRGFGYWRWKPMIIESTMLGLPDGDILIYADAGVEFIAPVQRIIDRMDQDVWLFGNNWEHAHWCKRDVVEAVWPLHGRILQGSPVLMSETYDGPALTWNRFGKQVQASVLFFRVSDYSRAFVAEWLKWCLYDGGRLIDDSPSRTPNHPEFREHRHDQAILTTLAYREGIKLHAWPAVYNRFLGQEFVYSREGYPSSDDYPSLYHHHRLRDHEWPKQ